MKSVLIIGIGRFGHHLCIDMANRGNEVMVIDKDEKKTPDLLEYATAVRARIVPGIAFIACSACWATSSSASISITT